MHNLYYFRYPDQVKEIKITEEVSGGVKVSDAGTVNSAPGVTAKAIVAVKQTPSTYRRINDALTIMTGLLAIILVVKNTLIGAGIITVDRQECITEPLKHAMYRSVKDLCTCLCFRSWQSRRAEEFFHFVLTK